MSNNQIQIVQSCTPMVKTSSLDCWKSHCWNSASVLGSYSTGTQNTRSLFCMMISLNVLRISSDRRYHPRHFIFPSDQQLQPLIPTKCMKVFWLQASIKAKPLAIPHQSSTFSYNESFDASTLIRLSDTVSREKGWIVIHQIRHGHRMV